MEVPLPLKSFWQHLGKAEKIFGLLLIAYWIARSFESGRIAALFLLLGAIVAGVWVVLKWLRKGVRKAIWRLRDRLVIAYMFIALVPVVLVAILIAFGTLLFARQTAVYIAASEFQRRVATIEGWAQALARSPASERELTWQHILESLDDQWSNVEVFVQERGRVVFPPGTEAEPPPDGWGEVSGLVARDRQLCVWARSSSGDAMVTVVAPLTPQVLASVASGLGVVALPPDQSDAWAVASGGSLPPPGNRFVDFAVRWATNVDVAVWSSPQVTEGALLSVSSRLSAVVRTIFTQRVEGSGLLAFLYLAAVAFLVVEIVSLVIGVSITRTVTTAVDGLYEGTQHVRVGDFSHRIEVRGNDQVATVSESFNQMAANLEKLLVVAKEKERLETELEIAREVQRQLYPKAVPPLENLELLAQCHPARVVSGDYYDYQPLGSGNAIIALGDVAGKGISAALLMATLQSSLRTQVRACLDEGGSLKMSPSRLVARLNQQVHNDTAPEKYATFLFGVYDGESSTLTYTNAGHLPPVLIRDGKVSQLDVNGMVVGAFPFASYDESRIRMEKGDLLVAYTDGITEPENEYGEMFGESRLFDLLQRVGDLEVARIIRTVMNAVAEWTGSPELQDDMTLLVARKH